MKRFLKPAYLPWAVLVCGILTFFMRLWLFGLGRDERDLLSAGSFPDVASWILVAVTMALLGLGMWKLQGKNHYKANFPPALIPAISMALAAVSFGFSSAMDFSAAEDSLGTVCCVFGLLAAAALLLLAWCRFKGLRPNMLLHTLVCVYLMLYLVSHYRGWSAFPQLQSYAFELLAIVFTMLSCYQRTAFDLDKGDCRMYSFFSLAALFFSIAALPGCDDPVFFIGCAVWMFFTPCRLTLSVPKEN